MFDGSRLRLADPGAAGDDVAELGCRSGQRVELGEVLASMRATILRAVSSLIEYSTIPQRRP